LAYLQNVDVLVVNDANYAELKICQAKLIESQFWEEMFRDHASALQANVPAPASRRANNQANKHVITALASKSPGVSIQAYQRVTTALASKSVIVVVPYSQVRHNGFHMLCFRYTSHMVFACE
jgi:predicted RecB family nuclease